MRGAFHTFLIDETNKLYGIGGNKKGQLGLGNFDFAWDFTQVHLNENESDLQIKNIFCNDERSVAIDDEGNTWVAGDNYEGRLGHDSYNQNTFTKIEILDDDKKVELKSVYFEDGHTLALSKNGDIWMAGRDCHGYIAKDVRFRKFEKISIPNNLLITSLITEYNVLTIGENFLIAVDKECSLWICKSIYNKNNFKYEGGKKNVHFFPVEVMFNDEIINPISVHRTETQVVLLDVNGRVWIVGLSDIININTANDKIRPTFLRADAFFVKIETSKKRILALSDDGNIWFYGKYPEYVKHTSPFLATCNNDQFTLYKTDFNATFIDISQIFGDFIVQDNENNFYEVAPGCELVHDKYEILNDDKTLVRFKGFKINKLVNSYFVVSKRKIKSATF